MEKIIELVKSQELKFEDELKYTVSYKEGYTDALNAVIKAIKNHGDIGHVITREFKTTEIVFKYPCGDTGVKYRADYGTKEAQELMDQIKHKSKYFYRHV